jgi:RimJ/RimL family protein N-acetyltransferase
MELLPALASSRLTLNTVEASDAERVFVLCQDPEIQRWVPVPSPYSISDAEFFATKYVAHGLASGAYSTWAIRRSETALLLGTIEVRSDSARGSASVGCWLGAPSRGDGIMTEALGAVISHAFSPAGMALHQLRWEALEGNLASERLATRLGFVSERESQRVLDFRDEKRRGWQAVLSAPDRSGGPV